MTGKPEFCVHLLCGAAKDAARQLRVAKTKHWGKKLLFNLLEVCRQCNSVSMSMIFSFSLGFVVELGEDQEFC